MLSTVERKYCQGYRTDEDCDLTWRIQSIPERALEVYIMALNEQKMCGVKLIKVENKENLVYSRLRNSDLGTFREKQMD